MQISLRCGKFKFDHVPELLAAEMKFQDAELLPGTITTRMLDATLRLGELLNAISLFVVATLRGKVAIKKLLIHLGFLASSLDHSQISNQIK